MKRILKDLVETAGITLTVVAVVWVVVSLVSVVILGYDLCQFFAGVISAP